MAGVWKAGKRNPRGEEGLLINRKKVWRRCQLKCCFHFLGRPINTCHLLLTSVLRWVTGNYHFTHIHMCNYFPIFIISVSALKEWFYTCPHLHTHNHGKFFSDLVIILYYSSPFSVRFHHNYNKFKIFISIKKKNNGKIKNTNHSILKNIFENCFTMFCTIKIYLENSFLLLNVFF